MMFLRTSRKILYNRVDMIVSNVVSIHAFSNVNYFKTDNYFIILNNMVGVKMCGVRSYKILLVILFQYTFY